MAVPATPKIYHILHHDKLPLVLQSGYLFSDAIISAREQQGTTVGMNKIKKRRLEELKLTNTYPDLFVGQCVPFYFCPRSVMLCIFWKNNHPEVTYRGGQEPIIHLEIDMNEAIRWANHYNVKWAFTNINAGGRLFEDYNNLIHLDKLNWNVIHAKYWAGSSEEKQAEFLIENSVPWQLVERIGVYSTQYDIIVNRSLTNAAHKPKIEVLPNWYY